VRNKPLILVVDDEANFLEIVRTQLEAHDYKVEIAGSGAEGIKKAEALLPDLILMDINLPGGPSGTDTALLIKQNPKTKDIKIAFLSSLRKPWPAFSPNERSQMSRELGMEDFLDKGEDLDRLADRVSELLER
jgi:CheY-like chemotaxis protein